MGNGIFWGLGVDGHFLWVVLGRWCWMEVYFVWIVVGGYFYRRWEEMDIFCGQVEVGGVEWVGVTFNMTLLFI